LPFPIIISTRQDDVQAIAREATALNAEMLDNNRKRRGETYKISRFLSAIVILRVGLRIDPDERTFLDNR